MDPIYPTHRSATSRPCDRTFFTPTPRSIPTISPSRSKKKGSTIVGVVASDRPGRFLIQQTAIEPVEGLFDDIKEMRQLTTSLMPEGYESLG